MDGGGQCRVCLKTPKHREGHKEGVLIPLDETRLRWTTLSQDGIPVPEREELRSPPTRNTQDDYAGRGRKPTRGCPHGPPTKHTKIVTSPDLGGDDDDDMVDRSRSGGKSGNVRPVRAAQAWTDFRGAGVFKANSTDPVTYPTLIDELSTSLRVTEFLSRSL